MNKRTYKFAHNWNISHELNIQKTVVNEVITEYIKYCKELLANGEPVDFYGLVSITPEVVNTNYYKTNAYICRVVASRLALTYYTVYNIISLYFRDSIEGLKKGQVVEIRSLVTIKPLMSNGIVTNIHSHLSQTLKNNIGVSELRVHTSKILKEMIKEPCEEN